MPTSRWRQEETYNSFEGSLSDLGSTQILGAAKEGGPSPQVKALLDELDGTKVELQRMSGELDQQKRLAELNRETVRKLEQRLLHDQAHVGQEYEYAQRVDLEGKLKKAAKKLRTERERNERQNDT